MPVLALKKSRLVDITVSLVAWYEGTDVISYQVMAVKDNGFIYLDRSFEADELYKAVAMFAKYA